MSKHTAGPWRYKQWGGLIVGGGTGSDEILICTMAVNTRHDEGRCNRELILAAPTMQAALAAERERAEKLYSAFTDASDALNAAEAERDALRERVARLVGAIEWAVTTLYEKHPVNPGNSLLADKLRTALGEK